MSSFSTLPKSLEELLFEVISWVVFGALPLILDVGPFALVRSWAGGGRTSAR